MEFTSLVELQKTSVFSGCSNLGLVSDCRRLDSEASPETACDLGCNPHCHFLLLLGSVSFDHSVLLDFLISTETCFLEYFVRYLRFLRSDPPGFAAACRRVDRSERKQRGESEKFRLVEYPSSDESDQDEAACQGHSRTGDNSRSTTGTVNEPAPNSMGQHHSESSYLEPCQTQTTTGRRRRRLWLQTPQEERPSSSKPTEGKTSGRTVRCLSQLRQVVTRLQAKELFPYNPSSLLKLLAQVENAPLTLNATAGNKEVK